MNTVELLGLSGTRLHDPLVLRGLMKLSRDGSAATSLVPGRQWVM